MQIPISSAQPGMILNTEITIAGGKIVLKKGQKLSPEIINALIKSAITSIDVDRTAESGSGPKISVRISADGSYAYMSIEPSGDQKDVLTLDMLMDSLKDAGVQFGIDESAMQNLVDMWPRGRHRYEISRAAVEKNAEPGREGAAKMLVRAITSTAELDKIRELRDYWKIQDIAMQYQMVVPGAIIAEKELSLPPVPGTNVRGEPVFTDKVVECSVILEKGAVFSKDNIEVYASVKGFAYQIGETIGVAEVNFDGGVDVELSDDLMTAKLIVHRPGENGKMPDEYAVRKLLSSNKITFGIHEELVKNIIYEFSLDRYPDEPVIIAEGVIPQNGINGRLEFLFCTETSLKPKENPDGSVDYKNVNIINSVARGDRLIKLVPPTKGVPGKNVCGQNVKCNDGVAAKLPAGPNTEIDQKETDCLIASIDGVVRYNGTAVEICEGFVVKGDVDFSTGHIKYEKSVIVSGDVKGGFNVDCGGDLQIGGVIEDSHIVVGGNLLCKYGLVGQGKGVVEVSGDANLGFMKNQTLKCKKTVNVAKEVLNSTIYARKTINVHGKPLSAAGGMLVARDSMTLYTVGNLSGIRTLLEVGIDFVLVEELEKTDKILSGLNVDYVKLAESQARYSKIIEMKGRAASQERALVAKLIETMSKYKKQMSILEERKKLIQRKMYYLDNSFIKIEHAALPGTLFKFGERHYLVKDEVIGPKTVRLIDHEIKVI